MTGQLALLIIVAMIALPAVVFIVLRLRDRPGTPNDNPTDSSSADRT